ncbi:hypothetical protein ALC56_05764 [Trachymyrmex septentrionalis]|uniref:Gustatory receptor n=1 Tax=Trachymyrmex septentrionalis TaxID=34720 RepID=A0A151JXF4_9HYME|nr:hypothetical protein ALC56_05764 [Trachymyrmex septentrionalis]
MMTTLQAALKPLLILGSFFGLGFFEYHGHSMPYLSCPYVLAISSLLMHFTYYPYLVRIFENPNNIFKYWRDIVPFITAMTSILVSWIYFKELKMCLRELSLIDDTMEAIGSQKKYQRMRKWIIRITIGYIVYMFFKVTLFSLILKFYTDWNDINFYIILFGMLLNYYPDFIQILSALIWGTILGYVSFRFHQVIDRLHVLYSGLFKNNANYRRQNRSNLECQRITDAEDRKQYIWILMHVHLQLCLISYKLNKVFKILMLFQLSWYFLKFLSECIRMYEVLVNRNSQELWTFEYTLLQLYTFIDFILQSILFFTLNYVCQTVYCKINETVAILHKLSSYNLDEKLRELILQFILQIKLREVKFGVGYYCYGYNLFFQELKMCLRELSLVDDTMEAIGSQKKYQRMRKWIIRITIGYIVYMFFKVTLFSLILKFYTDRNDINFSVILFC